MTRTVLTALAVALFSSVAQAGTIERACLQSDRRAANRAICGCIQRVANVTLDSSDQRLAASFFSDPHRAQEIRQSDNRRHARFWAKYRQFGTTAEVHCRAS